MSARIARSSGGSGWGWAFTARFRTGTRGGGRRLGFRRMSFGFARLSWRRRTARSLRRRGSRRSLRGGGSCRFGGKVCRSRLPNGRFGGLCCMFRTRGFRRGRTGRSRGMTGCWGLSCRHGRGGTRLGRRSRSCRRTRTAAAGLTTGWGVAGRTRTGGRAGFLWGGGNGGRA